MTEFREFQKIPRLNREVIVTEKIDGTNACVVIGDRALTPDNPNDQTILHEFTVLDERGYEFHKAVRAQSRSRIISPKDDNYGFAAWVRDNAEELLRLGEGYHYGEWWGQGINRNYGLNEKRFSLFNLSRWSDSSVRPACCGVVPLLASGIGFHHVYVALDMLRADGSKAAPGFMKPEGVVAYHTQGNLLFKATLEKDEEWKGKSKARSNAPPVDEGGQCAAVVGG